MPTTVYELLYLLYSAIIIIIINDVDDDDDDDNCSNNLFTSLKSELYIWKQIFFSE